ncbi:MAG: rhomboid family intramembrane serine protease [Actinobacteria bacterium]|nr:rhomboid family intramembrane serine protease [Actinomycetota bacterium]
MLPLFDRNPTRRVPGVTLALILANFAVFLFALTLSPSRYDAFLYRYSVVPWEIVHAAPLPYPALQQLFSGPVPEVSGKIVYLTLLTSLFLHEGWLHILGNMLFLWIFGNNVEDVMGHLGFAAFYLLCGLFGTLAHVAVYPQSFSLLLGASGAISGVMGAYLILYPRAWIFTWVAFFILPVPAFVVIGIWIALQVVQGLTSVGMSAGGTAWFAHLGGVAMGLTVTAAFYPVLRRRRDELALMPEAHWWQRGGTGGGTDTGPF